MADIIVGIIFVVIFYSVFKFIWTHVTTVSYNGLEGFFKSWGSQIMWSFIITLIIMTILAKIFESIFNFGRGLNVDFFDILIFGGVAYALFAIFSASDNFDRKTFRENYNRHVVELSKKLNLDDTILFHISHENPGNMIDLNDTREVDELTLAEDFVSDGSSKLVQFPNMEISHYVNKSGNYRSIKLSLNPSTCDDIEGRAALSYIRRLIAEITFTAAIEAVAEGKSRAIENSLHLINEHGVFGLLEYVSDSAEKVSRDYTEDGIKYLVSRDSDGYVYLKMIKTSSEGK